MQLIKIVETETRRIQITALFSAKYCLLRIIFSLALAAFVVHFNSLSVKPVLIGLVTGVPVGVGFAISRFRLFRKGKMIHATWFNEYIASFSSAVIPLILISNIIEKGRIIPFALLVVCASYFWSSLIMLLFGGNIRHKLQELEVANSTENSPNSASTRATSR